MADNPIEDPLIVGPPFPILDRKIIIRPDAINTVRLFHDRPDTQQSRWFADGERPVRRNNQALYFVRGDEAYGAIAAAIKLTLETPTEGATRLIYILGWSCDLQLPLIAGDPNSTLEKLLTQASNSGVEIRAMLWANVKGGDAIDAFTVPQVKFINSLKTGRAILDAKTVIAARIGLPSLGGTDAGTIPIRRGSHHQKLVLTNSKFGLNAFCGGIDFSPDRLDSKAGPAMHDVHCQVRGLAAHDLLVLFSNRWTDYINDKVPRETDYDLFPPRLAPTFMDPAGPPDTSKDFLSANSVPTPGALGKFIVQTGRTTPKNLYRGFRFQGEQSARRMILKAIDTAQKFIYMEDQYMLNLDCADALARAAAKPSIRHITIVIPDDNAVDGEFMGLASYHRAEFVQRLKQSAGAKKIQIHCANRYVHAKMYIFDDKYTIIGSANCNRRGWEHDSEVVVGISDESSDDRPTLHFARRLRMKLWADHFNLAQQTTNPNRPANAQREYAELIDGVASAVHWRKRNPNSRIRPYFPTDHKGKTAQQTWEEAIRAQFNSQGTNPTGKRTAAFLGTIASALLTVLGLKDEKKAWDTLFDPPSPL